MKTASWVIKEKATGRVIAETYDKKKVDALRAERYVAVPIAEHLAGLNASTNTVTGGAGDVLPRALPYGDMTDAEKSGFDQRQGIGPLDRARIESRLQCQHS